MVNINCIGDLCPIPVIKTKKALADLKADESITVLTDNIEAIENIEKMIKQNGYPYKTDKTDEGFIITIAYSDEALKNKVTDIEAAGRPTNKSAIVIGSDKMGEGDAELSQGLLKTYIYTLTELDKKPSTIIFYNSGVKLVTTESKVLDSLKILEGLGVDIIGCGACLSFYNLTNLLAVGRISNMYEIAEIMLNSSTTKI